MTAAYFDPAYGGDGSTVTDDSNPITGLGAGGHRTRFVPALNNVVNVAAFTLAQAALARTYSNAALNAPGTLADSTVSFNLFVGATRSFNVGAGKLFAIGQTIVAASKANPANYAVGTIMTFNSGTGAGTFLINQIGGSGTYADWTISLSALASAGLPSQATHANKSLMTDGTNLSWVQMLRASNNLSDLANLATSRTNLGLGALAVLGAVNDANWSGTDLSVANGGTGASTASAALTALGAAARGANSDITSLSGLSTALSIAQGGTGAITAAAARTALGLGALATLGAVNNANWSGTQLAVANGGTGSTTAAAARTALSAAQSGANNDITSLGALATPITVAQGGTGATTASAALTALGAAARGANSDITSLNNLTTPLSIAQGGTGAITALAARNNILPAMTNLPGGSLQVNDAANAWEVSPRGFVQGTTSAGGASINKSVNITSMTRTALGKYTIVFANAFPDAFYGGFGLCQRSTGDAAIVSRTNGSAWTANTAYITFCDQGGGMIDPPNFNLTFGY